MNSIMRLAFFSLIFCMCFIMHTADVNAQPHDDPSSLPLPDATAEHNADAPLTSEDYAIQYQKKCMAHVHTVYSDKEKEVVCGCTAAKMAETLTTDEFQILYDEDIKGQDVRDKAIAYAYAPCVRLIFNNLMTKDCLHSDHLKGVISGKNAICSCGVKTLSRIVNQMMPTIIIKIMKYNPLTLDPMEYYFSSEDYYIQSQKAFGQCSLQNRYSKENRFPNEK